MSSKYQKLRDLKEAKFSQLSKDCGLFWAFSNKQFDENKTPLKAGDKYVHIGGGGYLSKSNADKLMKGIDELNAWYKREMEKENLVEEEILYEINNHECYYTGDLTDVFDILPYPKQQIIEVYHKNKKRYGYS